MAAGLLKHISTARGHRIVGKSMSRYVRCSPRKARLVADLVRGKAAGEALTILRFTHRPSAEPFVTRTLTAAIASASEYHPEPETLKVSEIIIDDAPMMKRMRPASMGRAVRVRKRQCHIYIALAEN